MNLLTGSEADEFFGGCAPAFARDLLRQAAQSPGEAALLLWTAQALAPASLGVYHALYKHHARRCEFEFAERAARRGLAEAARQSGLPADWRRAQAGSLPAGIDFRAQGSARFWLFTLKALAFIALRSGRADEARALLDTIAALAPAARIGEDVLAAMLEGLQAAPGRDRPPRPR